MTVDQIISVEKLLDDDFTTQFAHHGDCVGADADFHRIARMQGLLIIGHPPNNKGLRAFCQFDSLEEPKEYLDRDYDIVNASDWMIFTPSGFKEVRRSGTWATIRFAKKANKPGFIVWPDGKISNILE